MTDILVFFMMRFLMAILGFAVVIGSLVAVAWAWDRFYGIIGAGIVIAILYALFSTLSVLFGRE